MVNLLPEEYKDKLRSEYRLRFISVASLFLFFSTIIASVTLLPEAASVGTDYFLNYRNEEKPLQTEEDQRGAEILANLDGIRATLMVVGPQREETPILFSEAIRLITLQKTEKITLNGFSFNADSKSDKKIVLSGVARDRESFATFLKRLSENGTFSNVDLPISNLNKKENIEFSLVLTLARKSEVGTTEKGGVEEKQK